MNTYSKFTTNVFLAKCEEKHQKGEVITVTTKYGKENESIVHNFIYEKDGFYYYSITRTDGFNTQERALRKAERFETYSESAEARSNAAYKKADLSEETTGIVFGQPILVGHYSEKRHRKTIERTDNAMRKSVEESKKAREYKNKAEYWQRRANEINLSMPESLELFTWQLEEAIEYHLKMKKGEIPREHSYSLIYAKKKVNELKKKVELAQRLWGNE